MTYMHVKSRCSTLVRRSRTAVRYTRENGLGAFFSLAHHKIRGYNPSALAIGQDLGSSETIRTIDYYRFIKQIPVGQPLEIGTAGYNSVNWVIPPFGHGSGGHLNIMRFVHYLEKDGFDCRVIVADEPGGSSAEELRLRICEWFFPFNGTVYLGMETAPPAHITVATAWTTAYHVRNFRSTIHRCYFVQDFEPCFHASGSEYAWAEATYRFGFTGITAGDWLKYKLRDEYGMRTESFGFSYDRSLYAPRMRRDPNTLRVLFYARPPTPRRAFEMGLLALDEVVRRIPAVKVVFAGWDVSNYHIPFEHVNAGIVRLTELSALYSQCDVALVLSFSNLSLLPLELMACGTPVVSNRSPCTAWLLNDGNACLVEPTIEDLADGICHLLTDPTERARLRAGGLATAASTDWRNEAKKVSNILRSLEVEATVA